jgi:glycosyltransferase involved in cell wall biosynthesis
MMSGLFAVPFLERVVYGLLKLVLIVARLSIGRFSIPLCSMADYMIGLLDQERYAEVRALLSHSVRKAVSRILRSPSGGAEQRQHYASLTPERMQGFLHAGSQSFPSGVKRSLLVVIPHLKLGGAEVLMLSILKRLAQTWRISILTTSPDSHAMAPAFAEVAHDIFHLPDMLNETDWQSFAQALISTRMMTHAFSSGSAWGLAAIAHIKALQPGFKHIHLIHNEIPDTPFRTALALQASIDRFVVVSSRVSIALQNYGIAGDKITQIENGIDTEVVFNPACVDSARFRERVDLDERPILLWIGRLSEEKRPLLFLDALEIIVKRVDVQAVMIGGGPLEDAVRSRISSGVLAQCARLVPPVGRDMLGAYYAIADMLVLTSRVEGMPLVVLEALAMGCPVAATDVGDIARVVENGHNGFLVDAGRVMDMVPPLIEILEQKRFDAKRDEIRRRFCATSYLEAKMLDAYQSVFER